VLGTRRRRGLRSSSSLRFERRGGEGGGEHGRLHLHPLLEVPAVEVRRRHFRLPFRALVREGGWNRKV
jgi:hypothetical protein